MRQLIARIDDTVHARLKRRAAAEGRSLNALVADVLRAAAGEATTRQAVRERARARGWLWTPSPPERVPSLEEVLAANRGSGGPVSDALAADRAAR